VLCCAVLINTACVVSACYAKAIYPAEVIGRDLNYPYLGWLGHVGVTTAYTISDNAYELLEALNETPAVQLNTISDFKRRSPYWGTRYGVADHAQGGMNVIVEANHQRWWCPKYTDSTAYTIGEGDVFWGRPKKCGLWRCDTYVTWAFYSAGYVLPPMRGSITLPSIVFNAFPYANGQLIPDTEPPIMTESNKTFDTVTAEDLNTMDFEEFEMIADIPLNQETPQHIAVEWKQANNPSLNDIKRGIFIDRLSVVGASDTVTNFLKLYNDEHSSAAIKSKVIQGTIIYYQNHLDVKKESADKSLLKAFYTKLLDKKLSRVESAEVIRGYVDLSSPTEVLANHKKIDSVSVGIEPHMLLGLKIQLTSVSKELEHVYIPSIITLLKKNDNPDLDDMFFSSAIRFHRHLRDPLSKGYIRQYMDSVNDKYTASTVGDNPNFAFNMARKSFTELRDEL